METHSARGHSCQQRCSSNMNMHSNFSQITNASTVAVVETTTDTPAHGNQRAATRPLSHPHSTVHSALVPASMICPTDNPSNRSTKLLPLSSPPTQPPNLPLAGECQRDSQTISLFRCLLSTMFSKTCFSPVLPGSTASYRHQLCQPTEP